MVGVVIPAAGAGQRMGGARKPLLMLEGRSVLSWALTPFLNRKDVVEIVVVLTRGEELPDDLPPSDVPIRTVEGGRTRFDSVSRGFAALNPSASVVVVHDGARPFPAPESIDECIRMARGGCGAVVGIPAIDTIKRVDGGQGITETPDRSDLWYAHTPQGFPRRMFEDALAAWPDGREAPTDDSTLVEAVGFPVVMVRSSPTNLKVTHPHDLAIARTLIREGLV